MGEHLVKQIKGKKQDEKAKFTIDHNFQDKILS